MLHCRTHREVGEVDIRHPACLEYGCTKQPSYGQPGRQATHCVRHAEPGAVSLSKRRCDYEGCDKSCSFGDLTTGRPTRCSAHKGQNHVDLKNKRCRNQGCMKHPSYGSYEEMGGRPQYCSRHRRPHHYDLKNKRCIYTEEGVRSCVVQATYGDENEQVLKFCAKHKEESHVDLRNKKCRHPEGCVKLPTYGDPQEGGARYCAAHKKSYHEPQWPQRHTCMHSQGCQALARHGPVGALPQFCRSHKMEGHSSLKRSKSLDKTATRQIRQPDWVRQIDAITNV